VSPSKVATFVMASVFFVGFARNGTLSAFAKNTEQALNNLIGGTSKIAKRI